MADGEVRSIEVARDEPAAVSGDEPSDKLRLYTPYLAISLLSVLVIVASDWLINHFGWPSGVDPVATPAAGAPESTARLRILTMLILLIGASAVGFSQFARQFWELDGHSRLRVAVTFCVLIIGVVIYFRGDSRDPAVEAQELTGQALFCHAAGQSPQIHLVPNAKAEVHGGRTKPAASVPSNCAAPTYWQLRRMIYIQQVALGLAIPAMILGALITLAGRRGEDRKPRTNKPDLIKRQIGHLNAILYLSAFILVCGLSFIAAYHHYPAYALTGTAQSAFTAHANGVVLFYGVSFSLLIVAFYLPAAGVLAARAAEVPQPQEEKSISGGLLDTTQLLKIALAVLSPVITGLLGGLIRIPGT